MFQFSSVEEYDMLTWVWDPALLHIARLAVLGREVLYSPATNCQLSSQILRVCVGAADYSGRLLRLLSKSCI